MRTGGSVTIGFAGFGSSRLILFEIWCLGFVIWWRAFCGVYSAGFLAARLLCIFIRAFLVSLATRDLSHLINRYLNSQ